MDGKKMMLIIAFVPFQAHAMFQHPSQQRKQHYQSAPLHHHQTTDIKENSSESSSTSTPRRKRRRNVHAHFKRQEQLLMHIAATLNAGLLETNCLLAQQLHLQDEQVKMQRIFINELSDMLRQREYEVSSYQAYIAKHTRSSSLSPFLPARRTSGSFDETFSVDDGKK